MLRLAACVKQQYVVAPLVSLCLLLGAWVRGRLGLAPILRCLSIASAVVVLYYGTEEWITGGRMSQSVFVAARNVGQVHPADWYAAANLFLALIWKCVGLILLLAAAGLAMVSARAGPGRRAFVIAGTIVIGVVVALAVVQFFIVEMWLSALLVLGLIVVIALVIPACVLFERSLSGGMAGRGPLGLLGRRAGSHGGPLAAQHGRLVQLRDPGRGHRLRLDGRALARACRRRDVMASSLPAALAALAVPAFAFTDVKQVRRQARRPTTPAWLGCLQYVQRPSAEIFFVDLPGANRLHGRTRPGLRSLALPRFRVDRSGRATIDLARTSSCDGPGARRRHHLESYRDRWTETNAAGPRLQPVQRVGPYFVWARQTPATR